VVAIKQSGQMVTQLHSTTRLEAGMELFMLGAVTQRRKFAETFN
jgi:Trk K+ transport system NAD-binding subunit